MLLLKICEYGEVSIEFTSFLGWGSALRFFIRFLSIFFFRDISLSEVVMEITNNLLDHFISTDGFDFFKRGS
jgi:hypothetical protein